MCWGVPGFRVSQPLTWEPVGFHRLGRSCFSTQKVGGFRACFQAAKGSKVLGSKAGEGSKSPASMAITATGPNTANQTQWMPVTTI